MYPTSKGTWELTTSDGTPVHLEAAKLEPPKLKYDIPVKGLMDASLEVHGEFVAPEGLRKFWRLFMQGVAGCRKLSHTCWSCHWLYWRKHSKKDRRYNKGLHKAGLWSCRKIGFIGWDCPGNDWCQCQGEYFRRKAKSKGDRL